MNYHSSGFRTIVVYTPCTYFLKWKIICNKYCVGSQTSLTNSLYCSIPLARLTLSLTKVYKYENLLFLTFCQYHAEGDASPRLVTQV